MIGRIKTDTVYVHATFLVPYEPIQDQCWKFLSPGRPGWRPKKTISQLLCIPQNSITTQIAVQKSIKSIRFLLFYTLMLKIVILCQSELFTFCQSYPIFKVGRPQDYGQIFKSFQHCHDIEKSVISLIIDRFSCPKYRWKALDKLFLVIIVCKRTVW